MPTVRRYDRTQSLDPLPGARLTASETPESEGAGLAEAQGRAAAITGNAVQGLAEQGIQHGVRDYAIIQEEARKSADETALLNASNRLADWKASSLYDPQTGAFTKRGKDAFPLPEQVRDSFNQAVSTIGADLKTPEQQRAFQRLSSQEWQTVDLQVRRHVYSEMQEYRQTELKGVLSNATDDAIRSADDPALIAVHLSRAEDAIRKNAPAMGFGPEAIQEQLRAVQSGVHTGVITQLLATDQYGKAQAYFDATKSEIAADRIDNIEHALEEGGLRKQAQQQSDSIIAAGGTLTQQREKARAIEDPKLRDQVMERIEHEAAISERADREAKEATSKQVYNILDRTGDVSKIPTPIWANLTGAERSAAREYADKLTRGEKVETDDPTYYALMQQAVDDPNTFVKQNLLNYRAKLSDGDFKHFVGLQQNVRANQLDAANRTLDDFRTETEIENNALTLAGIDHASKDNTVTVARYRSLVADSIRRFESVAGKKPQHKDIEDIANRILSQQIDNGGAYGVSPLRAVGAGAASGAITGAFFGGPLGAAAGTVLGGIAAPFVVPTNGGPKRVIDLAPDDVPAKERRDIEGMLKKYGVPVTDETVLSAYQRRLLGGL